MLLLISFQLGTVMLLEHRYLFFTNFYQYKLIEEKIINLYNLENRLRLNIPSDFFKAIHNYINNLEAT